MRITLSQDEKNNQDDNNGSEADVHFWFLLELAKSTYLNSKTRAGQYARIHTKEVVAACGSLTLEYPYVRHDTVALDLKEKMLTMAFPMAFDGGVIYNVKLMYPSRGILWRAN